MRIYRSHRPHAAITGIFLAALLVSAGAAAESRPAAGELPDDVATNAATTAGTVFRAAQPGEVIKWNREEARAVGKARPAATRRVYLEDYERTMQQVDRKYPTKSYWLGKNNIAK